MLCLLGSLGVIKPEVLNDVSYDSSEYHILYLCSVLTLEMIRMESTEPKMLGTMQPVDREVPIDIVNRIVGSERVSKVMSRAIVSRRCQDLPTEDELWPCLVALT